MYKTECFIMGSRGAMANYLCQQLENEYHCIQMDSRHISPLISHLNYQFSHKNINPMVILDFTHSECTPHLLDEIGEQFPVKWVIGTRGLSEASQQKIHSLAETRSIFCSSNFSLGSAVQNHLTEMLGKLLGDQARSAILDCDSSPQTEGGVSETAKSLQLAWQKNAETQAEISSIACGDGANEHTLFASLPGERLEITHRLQHRKAYLAGIRLAIQKVVQQEKGLFDMSDLFPDFFPT